MSEKNFIDLKNDSFKGLEEEFAALNLNSEKQRAVDLVEKNLQEITKSDRIILRKIMNKRPLKIYWGTAITGRPHIGYFLPILKIRDFLAAGCELKILLADIHGFLDNLKAPIELVEERYKYYKKLIKSMLKSVVSEEELSRVTFVKGSDFQKSPEYTFDLYKLSSFTTERDCKRAGSDVVKQKENCLLSSLIYPNMQALDEEYLKVDAQFGGEDQRKIFMHAKTFLPKIGYKKRIHLMNPMMPGLSSDKMSSSDESSKIDLLDSKTVISKKIKKCFCEEGNAKTGILTIFNFLIFNYFEKVSILEKEYKSYEELESAFTGKKIHPGDLKEACILYVNKMVGPVREEMLEDQEMIKKAYGKI
ncbi:tyrosine--tRNA [Nucleospora cyclopteri]